MAESTEQNKCPKCESVEVSYSNIEGYECMECGCWFDRDDSGDLCFMYDSSPE